MAKKPRAESTHFDQIPVDLVKKIVQRQDGVEKAGEPADVPAVKPPTGKRHADAGHFHGVQFYNDSGALCGIVSGFLGDGLDQGAMAIVIATPDHAARIVDGLRLRGTDVETARSRGDLAIVDARETLERFMTDGMPNARTFRHVLGDILMQASRGREQCTIRAYGEMVDVLWKDGREAAAIRLETLWNQLGTTREFDLLCGYSMGNFYKGAALEEIRRQHSHLVNADGVAPVPAAGL